MNVVAAAVQKAEDRARVRQVQQSDASGHHTVECSRGSQVEQSKSANEERACIVGVQRHIQRGVDARQPLVSRHTAVTSKCPRQARLPGVARDQASHSGHQQQTFQDDSASRVVQSLVVKLQDGNTCSGVQQLVQVAEAEEHRNTVRPRSNESDANGGHDCDRDVLLGLRHLFGKMGRGIQTGEDPVGVDQADDERHAIRVPARGIDEMAKDVRGTGVRLRAGRHRDQDHEVGDERDIQSDLGNGRQSFAPAVEEVAHEVDDFVCDHGMPGFGDTMTGWPSCHIPTPACPRLRDTLAQAKTAPAYPNQPVKHRTGQFRKRRPHATGDECDPEQPVDDKNRATRADTRDQRRRDTEP